MQQQWFPASSGGRPANGPARPRSFPPSWLFLNRFSGQQPLSPAHQTEDLDIPPLPCSQFTVGLFIFLVFWHHSQGKYVGHPSCQHHHLPRWGEGHGQLVESWQRIQRQWHSHWPAQSRTCSQPLPQPSQSHPEPHTPKKIFCKTFQFQVDQKLTKGHMHSQLSSLVQLLWLSIRSITIFEFLDLLGTWASWQSLCLMSTIFIILFLKPLSPSNGVRGQDNNPFDDGDGEEEWDDGGAVLVDNGEKGVPVRALYDYEAAEPDELTFKSGKKQTVHKLIHLWQVYCVQKPKYYRRRVWEAWGRGRAGVVQGEEGRQGRSLSRKLRWAAHLARLNRLWHWERSTSWWVSRYTAVTMQLPHEENSEIQEFYGHQLNLILLKSEIEQNGCNWDV